MSQGVNPFRGMGYSYGPNPAANLVSVILRGDGTCGTEKMSSASLFNLDLRTFFIDIKYVVMDYSSLQHGVTSCIHLKESSLGDH